MDTIQIGPLHIHFTAEHVVLDNSAGAEQVTMSYEECYELFAALYERRAELYRRSHDESKDAEDPSTYVLNDLTYTIDAHSVAVAGWHSETRDS